MSELNELITVSPNSGFQALPSDYSQSMAEYYEDQIEALESKVNELLDKIQSMRDEKTWEKDNMRMMKELNDHLWKRILGNG